MAVLARNRMRDGAPCWAAGLGGCSKERSQEHIISETVFTEDGLLTVQGVPWLKGQRKEIPKRVLASGILCKAHNELASPVDAVAGSLSKCLRDVASGTSAAVYALDGRLLERWCLKVMINMACGGWTRGGKSPAPPLELAQIVFGIRPFRPTAGLYVPANYHRPGRDNDSIRWNVMLNAANQQGMFGLIISVRTLICVLNINSYITPTRLASLLRTVRRDAMNIDFAAARLAYRPKNVEITAGPHKTKIWLSWD